MLISINSDLHGLITLVYLASRDMGVNVGAELVIVPPRPIALLVTDIIMYRLSTVTNNNPQRIIDLSRLHRNMAIDLRPTKMAVLAGTCLVARVVDVMRIVRTSVAVVGTTAFVMRIVDRHIIGHLNRVLFRLNWRYYLNRRRAIVTRRHLINMMTHNLIMNMHHDLSRYTNSDQQISIISSTIDTRHINILHAMLMIIPDLDVDKRIYNRTIRNALLRTNMLRMTIRPHLKIRLVDIMITHLSALLAGNKVFILSYPEECNVTVILIGIAVDGLYIALLIPRMHRAPMKTKIHNIIPTVNDITTAPNMVPHNISILRSMTLTHNDIRLPTIRNSMSHLIALVLIDLVACVIILINLTDSKRLILCDMDVSVLVFTGLSLHNVNIIMHHQRLHYRTLRVRIRDDNSILVRKLLMRIDIIRTNNRMMIASATAIIDIEAGRTYHTRRRIIIDILSADVDVRKRVTDMNTGDTVNRLLLRLARNTNELIRLAAMTILRTAKLIRRNRRVT